MTESRLQVNWYRGFLDGLGAWLVAVGEESESIRAMMMRELAGLLRITETPLEVERFVEAVNLRIDDGCSRSELLAIPVLGVSSLVERYLERLIALSGDEFRRRIARNLQPREIGIQDVWVRSGSEREAWELNYLDSQAAESEPPMFDPLADPRYRPVPSNETYYDEDDDGDDEDEGHCGGPPLSESQYPRDSHERLTEIQLSPRERQGDVKDRMQRDKLIADLTKRRQTVLPRLLGEWRKKMASLLDAGAIGI